MNERIKELAERAFVIETNGNVGNVNQHMIEQFAELIIRECARCVTTGEYSAFPPYDRVIPILLEELSNGMKEHFGVDK